MIGRVSADGTITNTDGATLTNSTQMVGETDRAVGGLYIDQTGVFGGDMIVAVGSGNVWRVNSGTSATRVAQVLDDTGAGRKLEGVITVPNNPCAYGPWAGKILTCAETAGLLCTVDTSGTVTTFNFGIPEPEDVDLIPANQNLFLLNFIPGPPAGGSVLKVPQSALTNFVNDIVTVTGEHALSTKELVIVHWDGVKFVRTNPNQLLTGATFLEHASFAPIPGQ